MSRKANFSCDVFHITNYSPFFSTVITTLYILLNSQEAKHILSKVFNVLLLEYYYSIVI